MMKQSIPYTSFVNIPRFWIVYFKGVIRTMLVCFVGKLPMKLQYIIR